MRLPPTPHPPRVRIQIAGNPPIWLVLPPNASSMSELLSFVRTTLHLPDAVAYIPYLNDTLFLPSESTSLIREGDTIQLRPPPHPDAPIPHPTSLCPATPALIMPSKPPAAPSAPPVHATLSGESAIRFNSVAAATCFMPAIEHQNTGQTAPRNQSNGPAVPSPCVQVLSFQKCIPQSGENADVTHRDGHDTTGDANIFDKCKSVAKRGVVSEEDTQERELSAEGDCMRQRNGGDIAGDDMRENVIHTVEITNRCSTASDREGVVGEGDAGLETEQRKDGDFLITVGQRRATSSDSGGLRVEIISQPQKKRRRGPNDEGSAALDREGQVAGAKPITVCDEKSGDPSRDKGTGNSHLPDSVSIGLERPNLSPSRRSLIATPITKSADSYGNFGFECWKHLRIEFPYAQGGSAWTPQFSSGSSPPRPLANSLMCSVTPRVLSEAQDQRGNGTGATNGAPINLSSSRMTQTFGGQEADLSARAEEIKAKPSSPCNPEGSLTGKRAHAEMAKVTAAHACEVIFEEQDQATRPKEDMPENSQGRQKRKRILTANAKRRRNARNRKREKKNRESKRKAGRGKVSTKGDLENVGESNQGKEQGHKNYGESNQGKKEGPQYVGESNQGKMDEDAIAATIGTTVLGPLQQEREGGGHKKDLPGLTEQSGSGKLQVSEVVTTSHGQSSGNEITLGRPLEPCGAETAGLHNAAETEESDIQVQALAKVRELLSKRGAPQTLAPSKGSQGNQNSKEEGKGKHNSLFTAMGSVSAVLARARSEGLLGQGSNSKEGQSNESLRRRIEGPRLDGQNSSRISKKKKRPARSRTTKLSKQEFYKNETQHNQSIYLGFEDGATDPSNFAESQAPGNKCQDGVTNGLVLKDEGFTNHNVGTEHLNDKETPSDGNHSPANVPSAAVGSPNKVNGAEHSSRAQEGNISSKEDPGISQEPDQKIIHAGTGLPVVAAKATP